MNLLKIFGVIWALYFGASGLIQLFKYQNTQGGIWQICVAPLLLVAYLIWRLIDKKREKAADARAAFTEESDTPKRSVFRD